MKFTLCFILLCFQAAPSWAGGIDDDSPLQKTCQKYLLGHKPYTVKDVLTFIGKTVKFTTESAPTDAESLQLYTHPFLESLYFIEPPSFRRLHEQETADAIEYAAYLKTQNRGFVFVPHFMGMSVPDFDGVVFDLTTGAPLFNVSLKHADSVFRPMSPAEYSSSLGVWSKGERAHNTSSPEAWFRAVNTLTAKQMRREDTVVGVNSFTRFKTLALAFGLFNPTGDRPLVLVRDLSDRDVSFDTAKGPEYRRLIEAAVTSDQTVALIAVWDRHHIWEFPLPARK